MNDGTFNNAISNYVVNQVDASYEILGFYVDTHAECAITYELLDMNGAALDTDPSTSIAWLDCPTIDPCNQVQINTDEDRTIEFKVKVTSQDNDDSIIEDVALTVTCNMQPDIDYTDKYPHYTFLPTLEIGNYHIIPFEQWDCDLP